MPLIEYTEPRLHTVQGSPGVKFEFRPGAENEVPNDVWENLKANSPGTQHLLRTGKLKPVTVRQVKLPMVAAGDGHVSDKVAVGDKMPPKRGKPTPVVEDAGEPTPVDSIKAVDITSMTSWDAIEFVKKVYTEETLVRFKADEEAKRGGPRKTVIAALDEQLIVMRTDPTKGSSLAAEA